MTALGWSLMVVPGLLLIYAGWSGRAVQPALAGAVLVALGVFAFANTAASKLKLDAGMLTGRSLLGHVDVRVDQISRIVPINLKYRRTFLMPWNRSARMFDVCTSRGPTGLFLSPNLYGEAPILALLDRMGVKPEARVEERILEAFSRNRNVG